MDKSARQTIRRGKQNRLKLAWFCGIPQAIQGRAIQPRSTVALILIEMLGSNRPAFPLSLGVETLKLLRNRLLFGLPLGRDSGIHRDMHRIPPTGDRMKHGLEGLLLPGDPALATSGKWRAIAVQPPTVGRICDTRGGCLSSGAPCLILQEA
jgi:hypothetical protein